MNRESGHKKLAPSVIVALVIIFILVQAGAVVFALRQEGMGLLLTILLIAIPFAVICALVVVYLERIREIDEEDREDMFRY